MHVCDAFHDEDFFHGRPSAVQGLVEALYNLVQSLLYSVIVYFMVGFDLNAGVQRLPTV